MSEFYKEAWPIIAGAFSTFVAISVVAYSIIKKKKEVYEVFLGIQKKYYGTPNELRTPVVDYKALNKFIPKLRKKYRNEAIALKKVIFKQLNATLKKEIIDSLNKEEFIIDPDDIHGTLSKASKTYNELFSCEDFSLEIKN